MADLNGETHQSLISLLSTEERDYLIKNNGEKVLVSEIVGKTVALYFSAHWCYPCRNFTPKLVNVYNKLKERGEAFEIVFVSWDRNRQTFEKYHRKMPWLALPFGDKTNESVEKFYGIKHIPRLTVVDPDGKVVTDATDAILTYGSKAYPFTDAHLQTVKKEIEEHEKTDDTTDEDQYTDDSYDSFEEDTTDEEESDGYEEPEEDAEMKAKRENQTLESLLVSDERNFLIKNGGAQVLVSELVGKIVGLYFSAHWCSSCRDFTPELVKVYNELKERGEAFEVVFVSNDHNQETFEEYYRSMPWLALPFGDETKDDLADLFEVLGVPFLIVVHPDGEKVKVTNIATDVIDAIRTYGAKAYPFTDAHLQALENKIEEHEKADTSSEKGHEEDADAAIDENSKPAGVICDGDVCHIAR